MKRRSRAGDEPAKAQRRKTGARKSRITPNAMRPRSSSAAVLQEQLDRRTRELNEALEQQTATADVLQVISRSTFDLAKVLNTLVESAARLCEADKGAIHRPTGKDASYYVAATYRHTPEFIESQKGQLFAPGRSGVVGRVLMEGKSVQIPDVLNDPEYAFREFARLGGYRTILGVPLLREGVPIGLLVLHRAAVRPFTDKQVKLVETFADQAVIAIENTRLFEAEQQRTRELTDALEQQTATSEVLQVISRSTFDLQSVLDTLTESAARLCEAEMATISRQKGTAYYWATSYGFPPELREYLERVPLEPGRGSVIGRVLLTGKTVHVPDVLADPEYTYLELQRRAGFRSALGVPLLREGVPIGVVGLMRRSVRPFTEEQIKLVETFADQAVIAVENTRLFEAEQQRTRELAESLEQQTATSEVLQVISSSPGELEPVFGTMLENAIKLCQAKFGALYLYDGEAFRTAALHGVSPAFAEARREALVVRHLHPDAPAARIARTNKLIHIVDFRLEQSYLERDPRMVEAADLAGARSLVMVPMLKESRLIGAIGVYRQEVRPFTDKQIKLVTNFAAQAVIAIENTRLLSELRESLQQQTATADVLKVISRSTFDLQAVFATLVESAARLCRADKATITWLKEHQLPVVAAYGFSDEFTEYIRTRAPRLDRSSVAGRCLLEGRPVQVPDVMNDPEFQFQEAATIGGFRTALGVPLMRENTPIGVLFVARDKIEPFTQQQIDLIATFADQAVIAIENTRLFEAEQQRTRELTESLEQQTATSAVLQVISSSPGNLEPVFTAMLENAVRICDAKFGNIYRWDGDALHLVLTQNAPTAFAEARRRLPHRADPQTAAGRMIAIKTAVHVTDAAAEEAYIEQRNPTYVEAVELGGVRTFLTVPMLKENKLIGSFTLYRQEVRPFTDKQIALVTSFASQAVIAIENARLLNELRESLQQQTATADVLKVISRSTFDLQTVLDTLVEISRPAV